MWKFDAEGRATLLSKDVLPNVFLTNGLDPNKVPVQQYDVDEAHRYLGDFLAPSLQMKTAAEVLQQTGQQFGTRLLPSSLRHYDAWIAYFAVLINALTYSLCVAHHPQSKLDSIQSFPTRAALMKCGFNCNTALAVVYGPPRYGGLGFRNLTIEQGIAQLQMIIRHLRAALKR